MSLRSLESVASMGHDYDAAGRRELTRREDGTWWTYGYNTRSEVTAAAKHATTSALVPGLEFSYSYDGMGNRTNSSAGSGSGMAIRGFTPNALNQYSTLTNNAKLNLLVRSDAAITATASRGPHNGIDVQGQFYGIRQTANNAGNGKVVTTNVTRSGGGTSQVKTWVPPNSLTPTYDAGGKLLKDGRWDYTWDGESRIVKMVSSGSAKNAGAPNITLRFAYDWMGRRIGKSITEGTSTTHESYAYDGWN
ncbi:hypothetical protein HNR46_001478, partial [Haloferula luteola]|nr:hypothetical protein [Haloferula luteola]